MAVVYSILRIVAGIVVILVGGILLFQSSLIYFPRNYSKERDKDALDQVTRQTVKVRGKDQVAFLLGPPSEQPPEKIWWLFGGNGALALDWLPELEGLDHSRSAYIAVDYPGYGFSQGRPSPKSIQASIDAHLEALSDYYRFSTEEVADRSSALGHSLGAAVALEMAVRYEMDEVVIISPFSTMREMAKLTVGGPLSHLLRHRYKNVESVKKLAANPEASLMVFHGADDRMIPPRMGAELHNLAESLKPGLSSFNRVERAGHNDIFWFIRDDLRKLLGN